MNVRTIAVATMALAAALSGCAVTRSEVKLGTEPAVVGAADVARKPIAIGEVVDARKFEAAPRDPSIPSLGSEGGTDETRARAVARKRNTYGMALGDVLLEPGQTVAGVVRRQMAAALAEAGYRIVDAGTAGAPIVDARILQFWSWFSPGFFTVSVSTVVSTDLVPRERGTPVPITVRNSESSLAVTDATWTDAIDKAMARWRAEVVARKADLP